MNTAQDAIAIARSQKGTSETPLGSNHVIYWDLIGRHDLQGQPWCAAFATWVMKAAGVPFPTIDTPGGYVYCPDAESWGKAHGDFITTPELGALVLFDWAHDGVPDHTGIVVELNADGSVQTVEGNTGAGQVLEQKRYRTDIVGFVRPPYGAPHPVPATPTVKPSVPIATPTIDLAAIAALIVSCKAQVLRQGSTGMAVGVLEHRLNDLGYRYPGMVDANEATAQFGPATNAAVHAFQAAHRLTIDGVVGPQTWAALYPA